MADKASLQSDIQRLEGQVSSLRSAISSAERALRDASSVNKAVKAGSLEGAKNNLKNTEVALADYRRALSRFP